MPVPAFPLNLAPRPSLWRRRHLLIGWAALGLGVTALLSTLAFTWRAYHQAGRTGREAVSLTEEARRAARQEQQLQASLQEMDATREQSRWKLAERILQERGLPWSRLTTELEQCMVPDMRLKSLLRARSSGQQVVMKLKGEARTREAEAAFIESLRTAPVFAQVVLERESERQGGGWDFEISLPAAQVPPPFQVKAIKMATSPAPASTAKAVPPPPQAPKTTPAPAQPPKPTPPPASPNFGQPAPGPMGLPTTSAPPMGLPMASPEKFPPLPTGSDDEESSRPRPLRRTRPLGPGASRSAG